MIKIKTLLFIFFVLAIVLVGIFFVFRNTSIIEPVINEQSTSLASVLPSVIIALTNTDRVKNGSPLLLENPLLTKAAQMKADDMLARQYYSHTTPEGHTPLYFLDAVGYKYLNAGENLDLTYKSTADDVHTAWLNSPAHRANLLLPQYTEIGVGVAEGEYQGEHVTFVVEIMTTPMPLVSTLPACCESVEVIKKPAVKTKAPVASPQFIPVIPVSSPASVQTSSETFISTTTSALPPVLETVISQVASSSLPLPTLILSASSTQSAVELLELFKNTKVSFIDSVRSFVSSLQRVTKELVMRLGESISF